MYSIDSKDRVIELSDVPPMEPGSPFPQVFADEHACHVAYYLRDEAEPGDGDRYVSNWQSFAIATFESCRVHMFGWPNEEVLCAHPLFERGLSYYGLYENLESSWIRQLERLNSIHDRHDPKSYRPLRHFIWTFHDSTFECIALSYRIAIHSDRDGGFLSALQTRQ